MMNGYEIILRNIQFDNPERVGLRFNSLGVSDVFRLYVQPPKALRPTGIGEVRMDRKLRTKSGDVDEWGCKWEAGEDLGGDDMGLVLDSPIKDLSSIDEYPFPDPYDLDHFEGLEIALASTGEKFVQLNSPFCLFERAHFLRGFEELMNDFVLDQQNIEKLLDKIIAYQIGIAEMAADLGKGRIHCFDTTDDWGTQTNLFISPKMWRALFKPRYKRLIDTIHKHGMFIRFHSDGKINPILPDLVELGVDILNIHQPRLMGIDEVSKLLRGKVCFEVSADVQITLPSNDKEKIFSEVQELVEKWATPQGGLIGVEYRYGAAIGFGKQELEWELEAFQKFGQFAK